MGNKASSSASSSFAQKDFVLGDAYLDSSSPHVLHPNCVSNRELRLVHRRGTKWYVLQQNEEGGSSGSHEKEAAKEEFLFSMESPKQGASLFSGSSTQVIVDSQGTVLALLQKTSKGRRIQTLIYRPIPTFDGQPPSMEIYKESVLKKYEEASTTTGTRRKATNTPAALPQYYLFARQLSNPASNPSKTTFGDSSYALLQVDVVYNDPDFAKFKEPPLYRAVTVRGGASTTTGGGGSMAIIMDGSTTNTTTSSTAPVTGGDTTSPTTILGTVTKTHAHISNGVDLIAVLTLGGSSLMSPPTMVAGTLASPRGAAVVDRSGVV